MNWDRTIGLIVVLLGLVIAGTYGRLRPEQATSATLVDRAFEGTDEVDSPALHVVSPQKREPAARPSGSADGSRAAIHRALLEAVERARRDSLAAGESDAALAPIDAGGMPDMEMTWEQYRGWTKFAAALGHRDYKQAEGMFPIMQGLFGEDLASIMADAFVEDYRAFLDGVLDSGCQGHDPESVWRKTLFMTFALARLNRSSASLEGRAKEARDLCGYGR